MTDNSRVIRFRAWNRKHSNPKERMMYFVSLTNSGRVIMADGDEWDIPVMQFTGLSDKNGNEIYEGDIIRRSTERKRSFVAVIEFKNGTFGGTTHPGMNHFIEIKRLSQCDYDGTGYDEIIGNIYEHPELLTALPVAG